MAEREMTESGSEMAGLRGEKQRKRGTFVLWFSFGQGKGVVAGGFGKRGGLAVFGLREPSSWLARRRENRDEGGRSDQFRRWVKEKKPTGTSWGVRRLLGEEIDLGFPFFFFFNSPKLPPSLYE